MVMVADSIGEVKEPSEMINDDHATARDEGERGERYRRPSAREVGEIDEVRDDAEKGE